MAIILISMRQEEIILDLKIRATQECMQDAREAKNYELYRKLKKEYKRLKALANTEDSDAN